MEPQPSQRGHPPYGATTFLDVMAVILEAGLH